jgi:aminopeptidase N
MSVDQHSFAQPDKVRLIHCSLSLVASFDVRRLRGTALLTVKRFDSAAPLLLDTRALEIEAVSCQGQPLKFDLAEAHPILGSALSISLPVGVDTVEIRYATSPHASGLQWLQPEQTAGKRHPFLFSQSQSIHARSWIPLQDSPGIRFTYDAQIEAPAELLVLMSARQQRHEGERHSL